MNSYKTRAGDSIQDYYAERFLKFEGDVRTLWNSRKSQEDRFHILAEVGDLEGKQILDVGCGFGDFQDFLNGQSIKVEYTGIDVQPDILMEARRRHPGLTFKQIDFLEFSPQEKYDYIFASGMFGLKMEDQSEYLRTMLSRMFSLADQGVAVNFLSSFTTGEQDGDSYHVDPQVVLGLALSLTPCVVLRHDYRDNDFTLYLYPHPSRKPL